MNIKYSNFDELFNVNQEALDGFFKTQLHTWEDLTKLQSEFANLWLECLNAQMQRVSSAKSLNDIYAAEAGLTTEYSMKFSDNIRKVYDTLVKSQKEFMECCSMPESLFRQLPAAKAERAGKGKAPEIDKDMPRGKAVS